jgi:flagellar FliJ protein
MPQLHTLTVLLRQTERLRDEALAEHQRAQAAQAAARAQAEQLQHYRSDYEQRWTSQFSRQGPMELVHCYQSFTDRLTHAVEQQGLIAERAAQRTAQAGSALQAIELRCASVRKLIERRTHERRQEAQRRDQKQTDEFAARTAWARAQADDHTKSQ